MNNTSDPRETYDFPIPLWKPSGMRIAGGQGIMRLGRFTTMFMDMSPWVGVLGVVASPRHSGGREGPVAA